MPNPDIRKLDGLLPGYRGLEEFTIGADDIELPEPRLVRTLSAGRLDYTDSEGRDQQTGTLSVGDDVVGPGGQLVYVQTLKGSSSVTRIQTGIT